jgi:hypothetical protein
MVGAQRLSQHGDGLEGMEIQAQPIIPPDLREKPRRLVNSDVRCYV